VSRCAWKLALGSDPRADPSGRDVRRSEGATPTWWYAAIYLPFVLRVQPRVEVEGAATRDRLVAAPGSIVESSGGGAIRPVARLTFPSPCLLVLAAC
jgi:hypothetical protein